MQQQFPDIDILFIAGFGPIACDVASSKEFYVTALGLPLRPLGANADYLVAEPQALEGAKHFSIWPLAQAAESCFGSDQWPADLPVPQAWIEFDVADMAQAGDALIARGYHLLVNDRKEPWGQRVTRLLSPEGLLVGITMTPWMREEG